MRESKGKSICSLLGHKVAHGSTVDEDLDGGMVQCALECHGLLHEQAADLEGVHGQ